MFSVFSQEDTAKRFRWGRHYSRELFAVAGSKGNPAVCQAAAPASAGGPLLSGKENSSLLSFACKRHSSWPGKK